MKIELVELDALIPYARNSRTHSDAQVAQIAASIKEFGFTNPVLIDETGSIIAGHGRVMAARKLAIADVPSIRLTHLTKAQKKAYVIADNKLALNAGWDNELMALELDELGDMGFDLDLTGFSADEIKYLMFGEDEVDDSKYTKKIDAPTYEPSGDQPPIADIYDSTKYQELTAKIHGNPDMRQDVKDFLLAAASRHISFDFEQIAEYYAHADPDLQQLMEDSALVIIDFDKAIANGYVKLSQAISKAYASEKGENE